MTPTALSNTSDAPFPSLSSFHDVRGRDVAALMNPRPIVIVGSSKPADAGEGEDPGGSADPQGERPRFDIGFATVIWATPVSHEPPLVAFALREASYTMSIIQKTGVFTLSLLPDDGESASIAELCGNQSGHRTRKDLLVPHHFVDAAGIAAPIPDKSLSWELCRVEHIETAGDHLLVIGSIVQAASRAPYDTLGRLASRETLLCVQRGCYGAIAAPKRVS